MSEKKVHGSYNHEEDCIEKACGVDQNYLASTLNELSGDGKELGKITFSQRVEKIENSDLSRRELAFVLTSNNDILMSLMNHPLGNMILSTVIDHEHNAKTK